MAKYQEAVETLSRAEQLDPRNLEVERILKGARQEVRTPLTVGQLYSRVSFNSFCGCYAYIGICPVPLPNTIAATNLLKSPKRACALDLSLAGACIFTMLYRG
eukprot:9206108-Pyramimonas_sp.AAC.1